MIDTKDKLIIDELVNSGREPASSIADKIDLSVPSVIERIKKMQDADIISGFKAVINYKKLGYDVAALITVISESSSNYSDIVEKSKNMSEVVRCFATTGSGSHVILVNAKDTDSLEKILRNIQGWPEVKRTETQIILSTH